MNSFDFNYRYAVVRKISKSLPEQAIRDFSDGESIVNFEKAQKEWDEYVNALKTNKNMKVVIIDSDDDLADCVFTEDTMVAVPSLKNPGKTLILVTTPGAASRRSEIKQVLKTLKDLNDDTLQSGSLYNTAQHSSFCAVLCAAE